MAKYKTTYFTTAGTFSIEVEGDVDGAIDDAANNAVERLFRADYVTLATPSSPKSGKPQQRTIIVKEHIVAMRIEEELEL